MRPPRNDRELMRDFDRRIDALEHPASVRVGQWVLSTSPDTGNLIASHGDGGSVVLAEVPPSTQEPDEVVRDERPILRLRRVEEQQTRSGRVERVLWDTVDMVRGGWEFNREDGEDSSDVHEAYCPESGLYLVVLKVSWMNHSTNSRKLMLHIGDGDPDTREDRPGDALYLTQYIPAVRWIEADQRVSAIVYSGNNGSIGQAAADAQSFTSLDIVQLRRGDLL